MQSHKVFSTLPHILYLYIQVTLTIVYLLINIYVNVVRIVTLIIINILLIIFINIVINLFWELTIIGLYL